MNAYKIIIEAFEKEGFTFKQFVYIKKEEYLHFVNEKTRERLNISCEVS